MKAIIITFIILNIILNILTYALHVSSTNQARDVFDSEKPENKAMPIITALAKETMDESHPSWILYFCSRNGVEYVYVTNGKVLTVSYDQDGKPVRCKP